MAVETRNKVLLTDLQSFGPVDYYIGLEYYDELIFEQYEHYQRGTYTNRFYIAGPNGTLLLSVPLQHSRGIKMPIKDLEICNRYRWQALHWKTLISAYRRSPWFEFYEEELSVMYFKKFKYLLDWNLEAFKLVSRWVEREWAVSLTASYQMPNDVPGIVDGRHRVKPQKKGAAVNQSPLYYPQVFEERNGFIPGLSILDLIFCEGKMAGQLLAAKGNCEKNSF